jgi:protein-disulfide isomerase
MVSFYAYFLWYHTGEYLKNRADLQSLTVYTTNMNKSFWAIIAVIIVIFGGILVFNNHKASAPNGGSGTPTNHVEGQGSAGVTLVEYGDYQCPYCGQYFPIVQAVQQKYNTQITFQFRNLPLLQIHQNAFAAARAAEAASLQGKFWDMHDLLYQNQTTWGESSNAQVYFQQYASQLSLNVQKFTQDAASSQVNDTINADVSAFLKTGQEESTPTFFLDGKKIQPGYSVDAFSKLIDAEIAAKHKA